MAESTSLEQLKKTILSDSPRLRESDRFSFACQPDMPCFTKCCADVTIVLTPYDIIRLKRRLGMGSEEFLERYCLLAHSASQRLPVVMLRMSEDDKRCQLVGEQGCTVYEDRPWACRMYPVGVASPKHSLMDPGEQAERFYFILEEGDCKGHGADRELTIGEWIRDQGADEYDELGELFKEVMLHPTIMALGKLDKAKMEMLHMACYNVDKFRRFLFESTFFDRFEIDEATQEAIREDDVALLKFGFQWLRFALFREPTFTVKDTAKQALYGNWAE